MATIVHCYLEQWLKKFLSTKNIRAVVDAMKDGSFLKRRMKNETA